MKKVLMIISLCIFVLGCNNQNLSGIKQPNSVLTESSRVTYPSWSSDKIYTSGDKVSHAGSNWQAKWWTTGEEPGTTGEWGVWNLLTQTTPELKITLISNKENVKTGESITLTWNSENATTVTASGGWSGTKSTSGSEIITNLTKDTTFTLVAEDSLGNKKSVSKVIQVNTGIVAEIIDGPYVFNRNGKVIVKYITSKGAVTETYNSRSEAKLKCKIPGSNNTFTIDLKTVNREPSTYIQPGKFLAISDIEGSFNAFIMALKGAGVIDNALNWIYGSGHLFIVGDIFDRGTNVTECLWFLYKLESLANISGGKIHFILGNHDIMNLRGDFRYVASKYTNNMRIIGESLKSAYSKDSELGSWLRTKNIIEKAGKFIFCHGGISPAVQQLNISIDKMNDYGRHHIDDSCVNNDCRVVNGGSDTGIYWYRGMTRKNLTQSQVDSISNTFLTNYIILGHTIFSDITSLYNSKVIAIDLDHASNYQRGYMKALVYKDSTMYKLKTNGSTATYTLLR